MNPVALRSAILAWYDADARELPWRVGPREHRAGVRPDPYRVWLSEIMLQQTTVPHATPYFLAFTRRWPTVADLAAAEDDDVMGAWAGLGYYARARNLLACARAVAGEHGGVFPSTEKALQSLPGVGPYTAAAIAAICFDRPANVVDGNVERVMARLFAVELPLPGAKSSLKDLAGSLIVGDRPGDWAQALMDLGATICRPKSPHCDRCPAADQCLALERGDPERFPRRSARRARPRRHGVVWIIEDGDGRLALVRRETRGLLGGMLGLPTSDWRPSPFGPNEAEAAAPVRASWRELGEVEHVFTHFALTLRVYATRASAPPGAVMADEAALAALPSVFLKAARLKR